ncbi:MAG: biotin transporter BioY [Alphaproteobacteria bacterium]|jgi:biotin transport system substrate-specific component
MSSPVRDARLPELLVGSVRDGRGLLRAVLLALAGSVLLTLSAKLKVPFHPVPMTMQTMVVLVLGVAYGSRLGAATVALYLLQGAIGLPVFADTPERGVGIAYMAGPTGGYLAGFLAAAWLAGAIGQGGLLRLAAAMLAGHAVIFAFGLAWLATAIGVEKAWLVGVAPFLLATLLKSALGVALVAGLKAWAPRR